MNINYPSIIWMNDGEGSTNTQVHIIRSIEITMCCLKCIQLIALIIIFSFLIIFVFFLLTSFGNKINVRSRVSTHILYIDLLCNMVEKVYSLLPASVRTHTRTIKLNKYKMLHTRRHKR